MSSVRLVLVLVLPVLGLVSVPPAQALSCVSPTAVASRSEALFTGRIRDFRDHRFLVEVEEIWRGAVPNEVWLATDKIGYWSDMKTFRSGTIPDGFSSETLFVFAPSKRTNYPLTVNVCTMWDSFTPWNADLRELRPALPLRPSATAVVQEPDATVNRGSGSPTGLIAGIAAGVVLTGAGATIAWRRRRTD